MERQIEQQTIHKGSHLFTKVFFMLPQGDQVDHAIQPKGKHAHQRALRGLHTAGVTDVAHHLLQSPIKQPEPTLLHSRIVSPVGSSGTPLSFHLPTQDDVHPFVSQSADVGCVPECTVLVFPLVVWASGGWPCFSPSTRASHGLSLFLWMYRSFALQDQPFVLSKVYSVSDLLQAKVAGVDREEVVDITSGRVVTQLPSLADLMDYDIDPADLRGEASLASPRPEGGGSNLASPSGVVATFPRRRSSVRPSTMPASHGVESSPDCFSPPLTAHLNTPAPPSASSVRRHTAGASVRHRKLSVPTTSMGIQLPVSLVGREEGPTVVPTPIAVPASPEPTSLATAALGRPSSPEPGTRRASESVRPLVFAPRTGSRDSNDTELAWKGAANKPRHGHTASRDSGSDVVELKGRGVLVRHGSKPNSLYGNMDLVQDTPAQVSTHMLTFTKSKSSLSGSKGSRGSAGDTAHLELQQRLWDALYGDGSTPSNSVVVGDVDNDTGSASTLGSVSNVWCMEPQVCAAPIPTSPVCSGSGAVK